MDDKPSEESSRRGRPGFIPRKREGPASAGPAGPPSRRLEPTYADSLLSQVRPSDERFDSSSPSPLIGANGGVMPMPLSIGVGSNGVPVRVVPVRATDRRV